MIDSFSGLPSKARTYMYQQECRILRYDNNTTEKKLSSPQLAGGHWFHFDNYEIRGTHIVPAAGALGRWDDPWEKFRKGRVPGRRTQEPPYRTLINLAKNVGETGDINEEPLIDWVNSHGLLGVLLAEADMWTHPPMPRIDENGQKVWQQCRTFRTSAGWGTYSREREGRSSKWLETGALLQPLGSTKWNQVEFSDDAWAAFFPSVPFQERNKFDYSGPGAEAFWQIYAEPVEVFLAAAHRIARIAQKFERWQQIKNTRGGSATSTIANPPKSALDELHSLSGRVSPVLDPQPDGTMDLRWVGTSLLGSFAMMMLLDLSERRHFKRCELCGAVFLTTSPVARYCCETHKRTAQKRREREKIKMRMLEDSNNQQKPSHRDSANETP